MILSKHSCSLDRRRLVRIEAAVLYTPSKKCKAMLRPKFYMWMLVRGVNGDEVKKLPITLDQSGVFIDLQAAFPDEKFSAIQDAVAAIRGRLVWLNLNDCGEVVSFSAVDTEKDKTEIDKLTAQLSR